MNIQRLAHYTKISAGSLLVALLPLSAFAQGGPPMVTDDPGTPGDKHWEINIAGLLDSNADKSLLQFPYFDVNYGWGERIQLKLETGWVILRGDGPQTRNGADTILAGVKWRFVDEDQA